MIKRIGLPLAAAACSLLAACGGGVNSTPAPPPAATPTPSPPPPPPPPPPTNTTLVNLVASQAFPNDAVTSAVRLDAANVTRASSQAATTLSVTYDAATRSYTVASAGRSETFGPSNLTAPQNPGQIDYAKTQGSERQYFTLTEPGSPLNRNVQYVGGGYWQRNETLGSDLAIAFDAFTYGLETNGNAVPRTGSAGYEVDLFGFFAPLNRTPKAIAGEGTFVADFRNGVFSTSGTADEIDLTAPYSTGSHAWRGEGRISSAGNTFGGLFAYEGRDRFTASGSINGRFYGPQAQELGAVFHAQNSDGGLLTGTLIGRQSANVPVPALTVLDNGASRSFYTSQHAVVTMRNNGATRVESASTVFPDMNGRIDFTADTVRLIGKLSSGDLPSPTFSASDRVTAESNARYTTYRSTRDGDDYRLVLYNPGAGNDELALTYTSFGRWDRLARTASREENLNIWFAYGVPTATNTLARTGSASYSMALHGSGVTYADNGQFTVSGTASMNVDFATMAYAGTLDALATATDGSRTIDFVPLSFGGEMFNTYGFESYLSSRPGYADGQIRGRLYGPGGTEVGASFDIMTRNSAGFVDGMFAGVAVGKRN